MSTKTTQKATGKKEFNLTPALTMWIYKSKNGVKYLSGKTEEGTKLKGFFNGKKKNPKEPDIRIYRQSLGILEKDEFISLWVKVSKGGNKYLSGKLGDKWVTGFFNSKAEIGGIIPYFSVYYSESRQGSEESHQDFEEIEDNNDLPY